MGHRYHVSAPRVRAHFLILLSLPSSTCKPALRTALVFTAVITPYEIALLRTKLDWLFCVNRLVDLIFTLDIFINFRLMFFEPRNMRLVKSRSRIVKRYLSSWFFIDLLSVLPGYIDVITFEGEADNGTLNKTMVLRLIRLAKLGRILKASRIVSRWLTMVNIKSSNMTFFKITLLLLCYTHWMACGACLSLQITGSSSHSWVNAWAQSSDVCANSYSNSTDSIENYDWETCYSPSDLYTVALYWSFANIVSGFAMWPTTQMEYKLCITVMAIGGYVWAYIIAHITAVAINASYDLRTYQEMMDQVSQRY
jgi:hypothetical protein